MADKILFDGKNFQILSHIGMDYKKNVSRMMRFFFLKIFTTVLLAAFTLSNAFMTYRLSFVDSALIVLTVIGTLGGLIATCINFGEIKEKYQEWITAEHDYNLALVANQDQIFVQKEKLAQHQANLNNIQYEKEIAFPIERAFTKNGS